jgi:hypothetical protein
VAGRTCLSTGVCSTSASEIRRASPIRSHGPGWTPLPDREAARPVSRRDVARNQREPSTPGGLRPRVETSRYSTAKIQAFVLDPQGDLVTAKGVVGVHDEETEINTHWLGRVDHPPRGWAHGDRPVLEHAGLLSAPQDGQPSLACCRGAAHRYIEHVFYTPQRAVAYFPHSGGAAARPASAAR